MAKLTMSRRNFVKACAVTAAACAVGGTATRPLQALATGVDERRVQAIVGLGGIVCVAVGVLGFGTIMPSLM